MAGINHTKIPNLSIDSLDGSSASVPSLTVASTASLTVAGIASFTNTAAFSGQVTSSSTISQTLASVFQSKQTTASYTSATLKDGEFSIGAVSATSCMIYVRSGATTYRFLADSAAVL